MALITEILEEMKYAIDTAFAAAADLAVQVETRRIINPSPPCIDMYPGDPTRTDQGAGYGDDGGAIVFTVRARVSTADQDAGQDILLALMDEEDPLSIVNALQADQTLGGTTGSIYVEGPFGHVLYEDSGRAGALLGMDWRATIIR